MYVIIIKGWFFMIYRNDDTVIYCGKEENIYTLLSRLEIDFHQYQTYALCGLTPQDAFHFALQYGQKRYTQDVTPARESILKNYDSILRFCLAEHIVYHPFCDLLNSKSDLDLTSLLECYMNKESDGLREKYVFYHVALHSICTKYQLHYKKCMFYLNHGYTFLESLDYGIITSYFPSKRISHRLNKLFPLFHNLSLSDLQHFLVETNIEAEVIPYILSFFHRKNEILDALNAYYIVDFFDQGWEEFYTKDIQKAHRSSNNIMEFFEKYNVLKKKATNHFLKQFGLSEETLLSYQKDFFQDYIKVNNDEPVWVYNRARVYEKQINTEF